MQIDAALNTWSTRPPPVSDGPLAAKVPGGHGEHEEDPAVVATCPAPHARHDSDEIDAIVVEKYPDGHAAQVQLEWQPLASSAGLQLP